MQVERVAEVVERPDRARDIPDRLAGKGVGVPVGAEPLDPGEGVGADPAHDRHREPTPEVVAALVAGVEGEAEPGDQQERAKRALAVFGVQCIDQPADRHRDQDLGSGHGEQAGGEHDERARVPAPMTPGEGQDISETGGHRAAPGEGRK